MKVIRLALGIVSWVLFLICVSKFGATSDMRSGIFAILFLILANNNLDNAKVTKEDD